MPTNEGKQTMQKTSTPVVKNTVRTLTRRLRGTAEFEIHQRTNRDLGRAIRTSVRPVAAQQQKEAAQDIPSIREVSVDANIKAALSATVADLVDKPELLETARLVLRQRNSEHAQIVQRLMHALEIQQAIENAVAEEMMDQRGFTVEALLDEDYRNTVREYLARNYPNFDPDFNLAYEMTEGKWAEATQTLIDMLSAPEWEDDNPTHTKTGNASYG